MIRKNNINKNKISIENFKYLVKLKNFLIITTIIALTKDNIILRGNNKFLIKKTNLLLMNEIWLL